jgi:ribosomal protein S27E
VSIEHLLICRCGEVLVKATDGEVKLRSKILIFKNGKAIAVCKGCNSELPIPVTLDQSELLQKSQNPKLFITK